MGEKDKSQKYLEDYNDVFADIFNVLLFKKRWIKEEKLRTTDKESVYKAMNGQLRTQQRDVLKEYEDNRFMVAVLGIENQSTIDKDMPIRVMGYDYAAYRNQIGQSGKRTPVITIVLNFSDTEWTSPLALKDILDIPKIMEPYVQDYKIHVFNIAYLPKEVRNQFTSDFKIVADYFAERRNGQYQPGKKEIKHVEAVLELLRVFACDERYEKIESDILKEEQKGGKINMCIVLDQAEARGIEKGMAKGIEKGMQLLVKTCYMSNVSKSILKEQMVEGYSISAKEADDVIGKYWGVE